MKIGSSAVRFDIPANTPAKSCLGCGARVFFIETARGKRMPVDAGGASHFATCSAGSKFRKKTRAELREQGELFGAKK